MSAFCKFLFFFCIAFAPFETFSIGDTRQEYSGSGLIAQHSPVAAESNGGIEVIRISPAEITIEPGKIVTATFQITNTSGSSGEYNERISLPPDWRLVIPRPQTFTFGPSEQSTVLLTFLVPGKIVADTYTITYTVERIGQPGVAASQALAVTVNPLVRIEMLPIDVPDAIIAGEEYTATLRVTNRGNSNTNIYFSVASSPSYDVSINPRKASFAPGESQNVSIDVITDDDTRRQLTNVLTIKADIEADGGERSTASEAVKVKILPKISAEFDPYHRLRTDMKVTVAAERGGTGQQFEYSGKGNLDEDGNRSINFLFRGPNMQDINPYGRRDEYSIQYEQDDLLNLNFGDRGYSLSPLTKMYTYGRGAEIGLMPGKLNIMAHYVQNRWVEDDRQVGSSLQYYVLNTLSVKGNIFAQQLDAQKYNNSIYSLQSSFRKYQWLNADVEYAYNLNDTENSTGSSYQVLLNGRYGSRLSYDLNKTHADPTYFGYYKDIDYTTGRVTVRVYDQIQARVNFRNYASNLDLDNTKSTANRENLIKSGLTVPFSTVGYISADYEYFEKADKLTPSNYDFTEKTVILNGGLSYKALNVRTGIERGIYDNKLPSKGNLNRERYRANIIFRPTSTSYYSFSSNIGNYKYSASNDRSKSAGIKGNWKLSDNLTVDLNYWKYNFGMGKDRVRDNVYATIDYTTKHNHTVSLRAYYSQYRSRRDRSVYLTYSIPINVPTSRIKSVGVLSGTVTDLEKEGNPPIPDVIVILNGASAITNRRGEFVFPSLNPGKYFLRLDDKSIGLSRVPNVKTPLEINIVGGQKITRDIGIITSGSIYGNVILYEYGKQAVNPDSTDFSMGTIQGLSEGELRVAGGVENVLLELSSGDQIIKVLSGNDGSFSFKNIRPGSWSLRVYDDAIPPYHRIDRSARLIELEPGDDQEINVKIEPMQRRIQFIDQGPVEAVTVESGTIPSAAALKPLSKKAQPSPPPAKRAPAPSEQVTSAADTTRIPVTGQFTVQVSSHRDQQSALDDVMAFRSRGYRAYMEEASLEGIGDWYRVFAGRYINRQEAVIAAQVIAERGLASDPWVKVIGQTRPAQASQQILKTEQQLPDRQPSGLYYSIQVASYKVPENARNEVSLYESRGYDAFSILSNVPGVGDWYRVYVGRFATETEAQQVSRTMVERGFVENPWVQQIELPTESP